jgi:UDP-N-acetylglucosamine--N-acetylmuramyl-(pentapeptide) pyrophosphoryl-undecaprenol N-acetylglucosamine transferase
VRVLFAGGGTGGHLMPALALAQALREARPDVEPVLVGAVRGIEADVLPRYPFRFHLMPIEPIYRHAWWRNLRWPVIAWRSWSAASRILAAERPSVVIGTGGYAAGPVVLRAQRTGIPTVLQEQNAFPGVTTRWLAGRARQVHLGFPEAEARLRPGPTTEVFTFGNPISPPPPPSPSEEGARAAALRAFGLEPGRPTLLVFGGSQGARAINYALAAALERRLLSEVNVLWGAGAAHAAELAPYAVPGRVALHAFFDPMAPAYRAADLVLCRAGAMTVAELCAWGKPSVLVPLPSAAAGHQEFNARALAAAGAAVLLPEAGLTSPALAQLVRQLVADAPRLAALAARARERGRPDAARQIVSRILTLLE